MARTDILYDIYQSDLLFESIETESNCSAVWEGSELVLSVEELEVDKTYVLHIPVRIIKDTVRIKGGGICYGYIDGVERELKCYQLPMISLDMFSMRLDENLNAHITNPKVIDFKVGLARHQNSLMTMVCIPGNYHRFPASGVGLYRFVHANNIASSRLGSRVKSEFSNDGVTVTNLQFDSETGDIQLQTKENEQ